jgi:hypothetical protein
MALTMASSKGGKAGFGPTPRRVLKGKITGRPTPPPMADGVGMQVHPPASLDIGKRRLLLEEKDKAGSLPKLEPHCAST